MGQYVRNTLQHPSSSSFEVVKLLLSYLPNILQVDMSYLLMLHAHWKVERTSLDA